MTPKPSPELMAALGAIAALPNPAGQVARSAEHFRLTPAAPEVDDRASIVAFLTAEAKRLDANAAAILALGDPDGLPAMLRLEAQASVGRTWAVQVARGDDRLGGGQ